MICLDTVALLKQRLEFLEDIKRTAEECGWSPSQVQELYDYLLEEVIRIDNLMFDAYEETEDRGIARLVWEKEMENLRYWLVLILGIKIELV